MRHAKLIALVIFALNASFAFESSAFGQNGLTPALPTARQYDLARGAVQAALQEQKTKVLQASGFMRNPTLKPQATITIQKGLVEIKRLDALLQQTTLASNYHHPLPMQAIDLAISATAQKSSQAVAAKNFTLLSITAQDISGLINLQRGVPAEAPARLQAAQPANAVASVPVKARPAVPQPPSQIPAIRAPASQTAR